MSATILFMDIKQNLKPSTTKSAQEPTNVSDKNAAPFTATPSQANIEQEKSFFDTTEDSLPSELMERVLSKTFPTAQPLHDTFDRAQSEVGPVRKSSGFLIVLGCGRRGGINFKSETQRLLSTAGQTSHPGSDVSHVLGDIAHLYIATGLKASLLVVQAKKD